MLSYGKIKGLRIYPKSLISFWVVPTGLGPVLPTRGVPSRITPDFIAFWGGLKPFRGSLKSRQATRYPKRLADRGDDRANRGGQGYSGA
jgi:hypothetical protein